MSDFLVTLDPAWSGAALLELLQLPYGNRLPEGVSFQFSWGSAAILSDPALAPENVWKSGTGVVAAVGDLLAASGTQLAGDLLACADNIRHGRSRTCSLQRDPTFASLNGAFAMLLADEDGPAVITDPLGSVQVYVGRNRAGVIMAIGTHPDLVATIADDEDQINPVSVFEFLNVGTPCFPNTMHERVHELAPGRLHVFGDDANGQRRILEATWWPFPDEFEVVPDEKDLVAALGEAFTAAVRDRCRRAPVAITLSGGLDSRLVMAVVPESLRCIGFTFLDVLNREARIARRVARCYAREWVPLVRDADYIARTAMDTIRFIGCEGDWVNAHGLGFVEEISRYKPGVVLSGLLMNNNVKGFYAADVARVARWRGLLPPRYETVHYDYVNELKPFAAGILNDRLLGHSRSRRAAFLEGHPGLKRQSVAEWLDGYPFSQAPDNTGWVAERRLMPIRLPAMDRRVLEIACRIPMSAKAGGRLFTRMARNLFGPGAAIPDANDGVRPGSNHVWRLAQRALREAANKRRTTLRRLGIAQAVPTSWHDYQCYWRESRMLKQLLAEHGNNLRDFEGSVFCVDPQKLCQDAALPWLNGFRFVQLALWKSLLYEYRNIAGKAKRNSRGQPHPVSALAK